eukprot:PhF_6_TR25124/c0_g1_i1/m.34559
MSCDVSSVLCESYPPSPTATSKTTQNNINMTPVDAKAPPPNYTSVIVSPPTPCPTSTTALPSDNSTTERMKPVPCKIEQSYDFDGSLLGDEKFQEIFEVANRLVVEDSSMDDTTECMDEAALHRRIIKIAEKAHTPDKDDLIGRYVHVHFHPEVIDVEETIARTSCASSSVVTSREVSPTISSQPVPNLLENTNKYKVRGRILTPPLPLSLLPHYTVTAKPLIPIPSNVSSSSLMVSARKKEPRPLPHLLSSSEDDGKYSINSNSNRDNNIVAVVQLSCAPATPPPPPRPYGFPYSGLAQPLDRLTTPPTPTVLSFYNNTSMTHKYRRQPREWLFHSKEYDMLFQVNMNRLKNAYGSWYVYTAKARVKRESQRLFLPLYLTRFEQTNIECK